MTDAKPYTMPECGSDQVRLRATVEALERAEADRDALRQQLEAEATAIIERLTRERDEARASHNKTLDAIRVDCDVHHGARRECGQCYDSQATYLRNVTAERDEARAELLKYQALHSNTETKLHEALNVIRELRCKLAEAGVEGSPPAGETTLGALTRQRDEALADAARCRELLTKSLTFIWDMNRPSVMRRFEQEDAVRATLADTTSDAWLAEVRATARDEALEEAADCFGMTADQERIRALKRGGK